MMISSKLCAISWMKHSNAVYAEKSETVEDSPISVDVGSGQGVAKVFAHLLPSNVGHISQSCSKDDHLSGVVASLWHANCYIVVGWREEVSHSDRVPWMKWILVSIRSLKSDPLSKLYPESCHHLGKAPCWSPLRSSVLDRARKSALASTSFLELQRKAAFRPCSPRHSCLPDRSPVGGSPSCRFGMASTERSQWMTLWTPNTCRLGLVGWDWWWSRQSAAHRPRSALLRCCEEWRQTTGVIFHPLRSPFLWS